jgi:uncharacterized protein (DUF2235 family)
MAKRLVVCLDGTWNSADDGFSTNVVKIMRAIAPADRKGMAQVVFYDAGVGAESSGLERVIEGATGSGLERNIRDGYRFLAHNWRPDDEIYIFGFSRGAFTARSLCGFIDQVGLLPKREMDRLCDAWALYREPPEQRDEATCRELRALSRTVDIKCLGVFDTVGSRGVPLETFRWLNRKYQFHNAELSGRVECAFHALAIDEKRGPFGPVLWQQKRGEDVTGGDRCTRVVEQVWFPGVHSNVGGGWSDSRLSDVALLWMIRRAQANTGLAFDEDYIADKLRPDPMGQIYDSRGWLYTGSRALPYRRLIGQRDVARTALQRLVDWLWGTELHTNRPTGGCEFVNEMIHWSAHARFGKLALEDGKQRLYAPANLRAAIDRLPIADERLVPIDRGPEGPPPVRVLAR